jgi:hypothetical protein
MYVQVLAVHATMTSSLLTEPMENFDVKADVFTIHNLLYTVWTVGLNTMTKQHKVQTSLHKAWVDIRYLSTGGSCVAGYLTRHQIPLLYGDVI